MPTFAANGDDMRVEGERMGAYYRRVARRAGGDARKTAGPHVVFAVVCAIVSVPVVYLVGRILGGGSESVSVLVPAIAVPFVVGTLFFLRHLARAPLLLAQDAARQAREAQEEEERRLQDRSNRLQAATDRLQELEDEPVPPQHRDDLQEVARNLLKGVTKGAVASYQPPGEEANRPNIPVSFVAHFPEIVPALEHWKGVVEAREAARRALRDWVDGQLPDAGFTGSFPAVVAYFVAHEAESPEPQIEMGDDPDAMAFRVGGMAFRLIGAQDRAKNETVLRDLLDRTTKQPERADASKAGSRLKEAQKALIEKLEGIRDLVDIPKGGGCALCRPTRRVPPPAPGSRPWIVETGR